MIMRMFQYKILFRHWGKNKIYPCISTFSLVIGLTCSTLLIGFAMHERRTAHSTPGEDQLYVVQTKDNFYHNSELKTYDTPVGAAQKLHEKYPQVTGYCTFRQEFVVMHRGKHKLEIDNAYKVTPGFDTLFQPEMISGNLKQTLSHPLEIAITRSFALRTFGKENPAGEVLTLETYKDVFVKNGDGYGVSQQQVTKTTRSPQSLTIANQVSCITSFFSGYPQKRLPGNLSALRGIITWCKCKREVIYPSCKKRMKTPPRFSCSPSNRRTTRKIIPRTDFSGTGIINS